MNRVTFQMCIDGFQKQENFQLPNDLDLSSANNQTQTNV